MIRYVPTYMYMYITTVCTVIGTHLLHTNILGFRVPHDLCRVVGSAIMQSDQLTRYWTEIYNHVAMLQCMVLPLHSSYTIGTQCFLGGDSKDQSIQKPHQRKSPMKGGSTPLAPLGENNRYIYMYITCAYSYIQSVVHCVHCSRH